MFTFRSLPSRSFSFFYVCILAMFIAIAMPTTTYGASAQTFYVAPNGSDTNTGLTPTQAFHAIQKAVDLAQPGDTIMLAAGDYFQDVYSKRNGTAAAPITISGPGTAVIKGDGNARIVEINHDFLALTGFTLDGLYGDPNTQDGYRDKLLYVLGKTAGDGVNGLKVRNMTFRNAGGECVRLRYFAQQNEIGFSHFQNCGVHDFRFGAGGKNGEGIYIGTAPEQLGDGKNPTSDPDQSSGNWIHHNTFDTQGNECVDIKELSSRTIVEYNTCTGQRDPESAGFDARGSGNIFRYNTSYNNMGAGFRLGGDGASDGTANSVYANTVYGNKNGGVRVQRAPQQFICGNTLRDNVGGDAVGTFANMYKPQVVCQNTQPEAIDGQRYYIPIARQGKR